MVGRKNHRWSTASPENESVHVCEHCGLVERRGWYEHEGRVKDVIQWWSPTGALLRIRPTAVLGGAPREAPPLAQWFPSAEVGGVPECPKDPAAWGPVDPALG